VCIIAATATRKVSAGGKFVCGIIGYLDKRGGEAPVGRVMLSMLQALSCRGPDSAGIAVFSAPASAQLCLAAPHRLGAAEVTAALRDLQATVWHVYPGGVYHAVLDRDRDLVSFERDLLQGLPGAEVISLGTSLRLCKQVGSPDQLEITYRVSEWQGSHGIGHTRLSTESRVDLSHSQPFWAHGVPDLVTVHNGHVTNYHKLRRRYEQRGHRFYTENDSEVIGVYLRERLAAGMSFEDALRSSLDDFDGSFSYLAATPDRLAFVKDRFGFKPLVVAETDAFVAIATEEVALRKALGRDFVAREPAPGTMQVWTVRPEAKASAVERARA
jgi:glutamate synthase domain-containing protein 1